MDESHVKPLRSVLTLHFAVIAILTAMLVSYGSESVFLPMFIFVVCVTAFILVDSLEKFALNRWGIFIGMSAGTIFAIGSYIYNAYHQSESGQLRAIAGLLVYPQAVLFMQRKNLRVYEQLAIFLLLEIMVAALVNDNLLFGLLLLPIVLLWVSSLFYFSRYATLVHIEPRVEVPMPKVAELLFARFMKSIRGDERPKPTVTARLLVGPQQESQINQRRLLQSVPLGIGAIIFAALFFYCLPRATSGGYRPRLGKQARVGLPNTLTLGQVGRALKDPTPIMRVKLTDEKTKAVYGLTEGPYIRARVYDQFMRMEGTTRWHMNNNYVGRGIPDVKIMEQDALQNRDQVRVEFDLLPSCQTDTFTLPPTYAPKGARTPAGKINDYSQLLFTDRDQDANEHHAQAYTLGSTAFFKGRQLDITPILPMRDATDVSKFTRDFLPVLSAIEPTRPTYTNQESAPRRSDFTSTDALRSRIISEAGLDESQSLAVARAIERYFAESGEYKYTLDLTAEADPKLDPIEDFVVNHRAGHCQYFAATMMIMLRQSGIPARLVVGYKPREFNSLGSYFHVRQSDAHAWVEARFTSRQLANTEYAKWIMPKSDYWIRFDPTPGESDDEVIEQPNSIKDFADKLWKGYVLEGRELTGENSLYAPATAKTKDMYAQLAEQWKALQNMLTSGRFGTEGGSISFAWPLAMLVTGVGIGGVLLWQLILNLPIIAPRFASRIGLRPRRSDFRQEFFARCMLLLSKLGFERIDSQTPQELTQAAAAHFERRGVTPASSEWLARLTQAYYRLRFGSASQLSEQEATEVQTALRNLEKSAGSLPTAKSASGH